MPEAYGLEFSPDGSKLYTCFSPGVVFQYDLANPAPTAMLASRTVVANFRTGYGESLGGLQLGPDGRIYIPHITQNQIYTRSHYYLDVIEHPDRKGVACGYKHIAYPVLEGPKSGTGRLGVPNVLPELLNFRPRLTHQVACDGSSVGFKLILPPGTTSATYGSLTWDFGDGRQSTGTIDSVVHRYGQPGTYPVRVTLGESGEASLLSQVIVHPPVQFFLGSDTTLCAGQTLVLSTASAGLVGSWQDGSSGFTYKVTKAGTYWADVCRDGCTTRDSIRVEYLSPPKVSLGPDQLVCNGNPVTLWAITRAGSYKWSTGSTDSLLVVRESGTYWVAVQTQCGQSSDTVRVTFEAGPAVALGKDTTPCVGQVLTLNAFHPRATRYRWQGQEGGATYEVRTEGTYTVELLGIACKASDTITVRFTECESELRIPNVFTPNGDGYNETFEVLGILPGKWSLEVYNRLGKPVYRQSAYNNDWRGEDLPSGVYYYLLRDRDTPRRYRGWVHLLK
jgi:gliding motility-associated-like protein